IQNYAGGDDAFVAKLSPGGNALLFGTYLGGGGNESVGGIALAADGNLYVAGSTESSDFPTVNPIAGASSGGFLAKLDGAGSAVTFSTIVGAGATGVVLDRSGNMYLGSSTGAIKLVNGPIVTASQPAAGPTAGGDHVTISGSDLAGATSVAFGDVVVQCG